MLDVFQIQPNAAAMGFPAFAVKSRIRPRTVLKSAMAKTLCDWTKKDIKKHFDELSIIVASPRYLCRKCARCAHFPRYLCEPKKVDPTAPSDPAC